MSTPSIEDYVKAIYKAETLGEVSSQEIANRVGVSAPAVSKMLRKLQELRFVKVLPKKERKEVGFRESKNMTFASSNNLARSGFTVSGRKEENRSRHTSKRIDIRGGLSLC